MAISRLDKYQRRHINRPYYNRESHTSSRRLKIIFYLVKRKNDNNVNFYY